MLLSVLIPARNEKYLQKTITNVLENIEGDTEIIAVLDGYWSNPPITDHPRVTLIHHTEARGQRPSVNEAAKIAKGKYLMKLDAHCAVDKGFDVKLVKDYKEGEVHIPRMYNLDITTFQPKRGKKTDYMYIGWNDKGQLRSLYYGGQDWKQWHRREEMVDDTMGCMGPCRFMSAKTFWDLGGCDENSGHWGSEGIEWACKAWLSGGALKVNKNTWFAHWFRGGGVPAGEKSGFPYPMSQRIIDNSRIYAENLWLQDKWDKQKRPFKWLIDKFNPPSWEHYKFKNANMIPEHSTVFAELYQHIHRNKNQPQYKGVGLLKFPADMQLYHQVIWENKPEVVVEIGTKYGGSALFFADQGVKVITIDVEDLVKEKDPRVTYILRSSLAPETIEEVRKLTEGKKTMFVIDGRHTKTHVAREIQAYKDMVTKGQYMVLEDCYVDRGLYGPGEARDEFLKTNKEFELVPLHEQFLYGITNGGWLRKI